MGNGSDERRIGSRRSKRRKLTTWNIYRSSTEPASTPQWARPRCSTFSSLLAVPGFFDSAACWSEFACEMTKSNKNRTAKIGRPCANRWRARVTPGVGFRSPPCPPQPDRPCLACIEQIGVCCRLLVLVLGPESVGWDSWNGVWHKQLPCLWAKMCRSTGIIRRLRRCVTLCGT